MSKTPLTRVSLEVISASAVLLGLLFVGLELRHANKLAESEAVNSLNGMIVELNMAKYEAPASEGLWANYFLGQPFDETNLSPSDLEILGTNLISWMSLYEAAWKYYETGILKEGEFAGYIEGACDELARGEFAKEFWKQNKSLFTEGYVQKLEATCTNPAGDE